MGFPSGTLIATGEGLTPIEQLPGRSFQAFNGAKHYVADAVVGPEGPIERTLLINGLVLEAGPEQRFWVAPAGVAPPEYVPQRRIRPGDRILMPYERYDYPQSDGLLFVGKDYGGWSPTTDLVDDIVLWRLLGFALADGYYPDVLPSQDAFRIFVSDTRDMPLLRRFAKCLRRHQIDAVVVKSRHTVLTVHHGPFQRWLRDLGFRSMNEGVRLIPSRLFRAPAWVREAILVGFFSCWGEWAQHSVKGHYTPHVYVRDPQLCQGVLRLLWSVGVAASIEQRGWDRQGDIFIRDIGRFQEQINFIQDHKRIPWVEREPERQGRWDTLRHETTVYLCRVLSGYVGWEGLHADEREKLTRHRYGGSGVRRTVAIRLCKALKVQPPDWLRYHHAPVDSTMPGLEALPQYSLTFEPNRKQRFIAGFVTCR